MSQNMTIIVGGHKIDLNPGTYIAQGGQATVHKKNNIAYKIYTDDQGNANPSKMIPAAKINELTKVTLSNVLGPKDVIYSTKGVEIGFTMPYIANTEFLPRLFVAGFRQSENITPQMIKELVKRFQQTMQSIHHIGATGSYLIVDANENNILVSRGYDEIYLIDVDSWKTPGYPADALMDSVRDRQLKTDSQGRVYPNQFSVNSDYFAFAVTATQMYLGCHPYKGGHPDYKPRDWMKRMDANVSIFDSKATLPPNTQDFSVIPPAHRKWLEGVLQKGDRSEPPMPDSLVAATTKPQVVFGTETFQIDPIRTYDGKIVAVRYVQGVCFVQTLAGFYSNDKKLDSVAVSDNGIKYDFCPVQGDSLPVRLTYRNAVQELKIASLDKQVDETVPAENFFVSNNRIYTVQYEKLVEYCPSKVGYKTVLGRKIIGSVSHNNIVGDGVITQSLMGKALIAFPHQSGTMMTVPIPELNKYKIIQVKRINNVIVGIASEATRKDRFVMVFDKNFKTYNIRFEQDTLSLDANFVVLDKGVTVAVNGDKAELFVDNSQVKVVDKFPLTKGQQLTSFGNDVYFAHEKGFYQIKLKS